MIHPSRAIAFREIVRDLGDLAHVRGGLLVARDGFIIAADFPLDVATDALAALTAALGRELEAGAARFGHGAFSVATFAADGGMLFVGSTGLGYLALLGDPSVNVGVLRRAIARAAEAIRLTWQTGVCA